MKQISVAIGIVLHDSLVLICQRLEEGPLGGFWEFPGGKCEAGETAEDCLHRELLEELEITVEIVGPLEAIAHQYPDMHVTLYPFICHWTGGELRGVACQQFLWVAPNALADYPFPPANATLIEELTAGLNSPGGEEHQQQRTLDGPRIAQVAKGRRATSRVRSYCLIGATVCGVGAVELLRLAVWRMVMLRAAGWLAVDVVVAAALAWIGWRLLSKSRSLAKEMRRSDLQEPTTQPNFSTLSDGSQMVKNLEKMR